MQAGRPGDPTEHPASDPGEGREIASEGALSRPDRLPTGLTASAELASSLDVGTTLRTLVRLMVPQHADLATLDLHGQDGRFHRIAVAHRDPQFESLLGHGASFVPSQQSGGSPLIEALLTQRAQLVREAGPDWLEELALPAELFSRSDLPSLILVPLATRERIHGILTLGTDGTHPPYDPADLRTAERLGCGAATIVDNALLLHAAQHAAEESGQHAQLGLLLADASHLFAESITDYHQLLDRVVHYLATAIGDSCVIRLLSEDRQWLQLAAMFDPNAARLEQTRNAIGGAQPASRGIWQTVISSRRPLRATINPDTPPAPATPEQARFIQICRPSSLLGIPLIARDSLLGVLALTRFEGSQPFDPSDEKLARDLAGRAALALDNARLYESATAAVRLRNQVMSNISHDLRTPLTIVKGQAQILRRHALRLADQTQRERLAKGLDLIAATASRMAGMIEDLFDASRLEAGEPLQIARTRTDLVSLTREAAHEQQLANPRHRIVVDTTERHLYGLFDASRVARVLTNLIGNAIKYSSPRHEIRVELRRRQQAGSDWAMIRVIDRGVGIPEEDLPTVFEPFRRGTNVERIAGTGIGLAGAYRIVRLHGGTIEVASEQGKGSTFTVLLPLALDEHRAEDDRPRSD